MSLRKSIEGLGPYPSLFLLALPAATVEPLKLAAVAVAGEGHWITGTAMIVACYAFSLLVVERLFVIVKPKLLTIPWFAKIWKVFVSVRTRMIAHSVGAEPRMRFAIRRQLRNEPKIDAAQAAGRGRFLRRWR